MNDLSSEREASNWFNQNMPDQTARHTYLSILANAIRETHSLASDQWSVSLREKPRLIVGRYITYVGFPGGDSVWLALDSNDLDLLDQSKPDVHSFRQNWKQDGRGPRDYLHYQDKKRRNFSTNGTFSLRSFDPDVWSVAERLSFDFIAKATDSDLGKRHLQTSQAAHAYGVVKYMRNELNTQLPDPGY